MKNYSQLGLFEIEIKRICVISLSRIISFIHPMFDIHSHPYEMFIFKCSPSLSNTRIPRLVQVENIVFQIIITYKLM